MKMRADFSAGGMKQAADGLFFPQLIIEMYRLFGLERVETDPSLL
jgi:hypothetical protein